MQAHTSPHDDAQLVTQAAIHDWISYATDTPRSKFHTSRYKICLVQVPPGVKLFPCKTIDFTTASPTRPLTKQPYR